MLPAGWWRKGVASPPKQDGGVGFLEGEEVGLLSEAVEFGLVGFGESVRPKVLAQRREPFVVRLRECGPLNRRW